MIAEANNVLAHPDDDRAKARLRDVLHEAESIIDRSQAPLRDELGPDDKIARARADELRDMITQLPLVAERAHAHPEDPRAIEALQALLDRIEDNVHAIDNAGGNSPAVAELKNKALAALARMRPTKAAGGRWKGDLMNAAQDLAGTLAQLMGEAKAGVGRSTTGDAARELADLLAGLTVAADRAARSDLSANKLNSLLADIDRVDATRERRERENTPENSNNQVRYFLQRLAERSRLTYIYTHLFRIISILFLGCRRYGRSRQCREQRYQKEPTCKTRCSGKCVVPRATWWGYGPM